MNSVANRTAPWTTILSIDDQPANLHVLVDCLTTWLARVMDECGAWDETDGTAAALADRTGELLQAWRNTRRQVIAVGMESHVCVFQTVRDLAGRGFDVFVPKDAIVSRTEENRQVGLNLCEKAGAVVTSTETVLFDLLGTAGTPEFKELSPLIR